MDKEVGYPAFQWSWITEGTGLAFPFTESQRLEELFNHLHYSYRPIFTTGVGKSAYPAKYMADVLASLGMDAHYLDPVLALHGDIGRYDPEDTLIMFSASGDTEELVRLAEHITSISMFTPTIVLIAIDYGRLHKYTTFHFNFFERGEKNRLGFPATSVILMMRFAAALCAELAERLNVTEAEYARNHPGGAIGKRLSAVRKETT